MADEIVGNCKIVYPSGDPSALTYTFTKNPDYGHTVGYLDTDDNARTINGALNSYSGPRKRTFELSFSYVLKAQLDALQLAWNIGAPMDLYLDGYTLEATVKLMAPPIGKSQAAFVNGEYTYSFDCEFEEV